MVSNPDLFGDAISRAPKTAQDLRKPGHDGVRSVVLRRPFHDPVGTKCAEHRVWLVAESFRCFADALLRRIGNTRMIAQGERDRRIVKTGFATYVTNCRASLGYRHR